MWNMRHRPPRPNSAEFLGGFEDALKRAALSNRYNIRYLLPVDETKLRCSGQYQTKCTEVLTEPFYSMANSDRCSIRQAKKYMQMLWRPRGLYAESIRDIERQLRGRETWMDKWRKVDVPTLLQSGTSHLDCMERELDESIETERAHTQHLEVDPNEDINYRSKLVLLNYRALTPALSHGLNSRRPKLAAIAEQDCETERGTANKEALVQRRELHTPSPSWRPKSAVSTIRRPRTAPAKFLKHIQQNLCTDQDMVDMTSQIDPNFKVERTSTEEKFMLLLKRRYGAQLDDEGQITLDLERPPPQLQKVFPGRQAIVSEWLQHGKFLHSAD